MPRHEHVLYGRPSSSLHVQRPHWLALEMVAYNYSGRSHKQELNM